MPTPGPAEAGQQVPRIGTIGHSTRSPDEFLELLRAYTMLTREFATAVDELLRFGKRRNVAVMCAEAAWWQSHRMLLSDALVARQKTRNQNG